MGLELKTEKKITKCCDVRNLIKEYIDKNLKNGGEMKIYTNIELLYKATNKANCEDCNNYYSEIELKQIELFRNQ